MIKITPLAITNKLKECAAFYVDNFGFTIVFEEDWYVHLVNQKTGHELGFMAPNTDTQPKELHAEFSGKGMIYSFEVEDAKTEFERLKKKGLKFILELKDEPWGQRHSIIEDPAGVYVDVVQQLEEA